jgi:hypothetical protein
MRLAFCTIFVAVLLWSVAPGAQNSLPALENAWILAARSYKQPSTQAPLELTLHSGARITVRAQDVHQYATAALRSALHGQAQKAIDLGLLFVLHVKEIKPVTKTQSTVTLFSGDVLQVLSSDIALDPRLGFLRTELSQAIYRAQSQAAPTASVQTAAAGSLGDTVAVIRAKCATDWPDDFAMRAHCQKRQDDGVTALQRRSMNSTSEQVTIRTKCTKDWPDDFAMRNYCEERQLEALKSIR